MLNIIPQKVDVKLGRRHKDQDREGSFPALVSRAGVQQQSNKRYQEDRSVSPDTQQGKKQRAHVARARSAHCHWKISTQEHEQIGTSNNVCNQDKVFSHKQEEILKRVKVCRKSRSM